MGMELVDFANLHAFCYVYCASQQGREMSG
jgi:hypothetical protein